MTRGRWLVHCCLIVSAWCLPGLSCWAEGFSDLPTPEGARVASLGDNMRINGARARLMQLTFPGKPEDLLQFYRDKFASGGLSGPARPGGGPSAVMGLIDDNLVTVRIAGVADNRVFAQVMQSLPEDLKQSASAEAIAKAQSEMPPRSQRISDIESYDRGARSKLTIYTNEHSVDANVDFVRQRLEGSKFKQGERLEDAQTHSTTVWYSAGAGADARLVIRDAGERRMVTLNVVQTLGVEGESR